jgi:hypothetical protein
MSTTIHMANHLGALRPAQEQDVEVWGHLKIAEREVVKVQISRSRNYRFHCKFFAMLGIILKNQEHYQTTDELLNVCKLRIGHVDIVQTPQGEEHWPKSISFASMDETEFSAFYERAVDWVLSDVIPGLQRQHLDAEIEAELVGFSA